MVRKFLFFIFLFFSGYTSYLIRQNNFSTFFIMAVLLLSFGVAINLYLSGYRTKLTYKYRWILVSLSSLSIIFMLLYRVVLPEVWDDYWRVSDILFYISCIFIFAATCIIFLQIIKDKTSTYKTTVDSFILTIPIILFFWLELLLMKEYVHRSHIDKMDQMLWSLKDSNRLLNDVISDLKSSNSFEDLYLLIDQAADELLEKSGGLSAEAIAINANNDYYADAIVIKSGYINKIRSELDSLSETIDNEDIKNEISDIQTYLVGRDIYKNTVTEMRYRMEILKHRIKIIELRINQIE